MPPFPTKEFHPDFPSLSSLSESAPEHGISLPLVGVVFGGVATLFLLLIFVLVFVKLRSMRRGRTSNASPNHLTNTLTTTTIVGGQGGGTSGRGASSGGGGVEYILKGQSRAGGGSSQEGRDFDKKTFISRSTSDSTDVVTAMESTSLACEFLLSS